MDVTKRNHYNPCFWTALWNDEYYRAIAGGKVEGKAARQQTVHVLNLKSQKTYRTIMEHVHYDKNLGFAEITREAAEDFCFDIIQTSTKSSRRRAKRRTTPCIWTLRASFRASKPQHPTKFCSKLLLLAHRQCPRKIQYCVVHRPTVSSKPRDREFDDRLA